LLKQFGVFNGVIDGDFGPQTEAAVILAQKQLKLTADGVVGAQTWVALQTAVA
jgi:peptidoglycan hydrolase-like protein with peptidoglycan-binding domain